MNCSIGSRLDTPRSRSKPTRQPHARLGRTTWCDCERLRAQSTTGALSISMEIESAPVIAFVAFSDGKPDSTFPENALFALRRKAQHGRDREPVRVLAVDVTAIDDVVVPSIDRPPAHADLKTRLRDARHVRG